MTSFHPHTLKRQRWMEICQRLYSGRVTGSSGRVRFDVSTVCGPDFSQMKPINVEAQLELMIILQLLLFCSHSGQF